LDHLPALHNAGPKVIEEQRLGRRESLTIGTHPKNTFVINGANMPRSHQLFVSKGGQYELVVSDIMKGRVSVDRNDAADMEQLKSSGQLAKKGEFYHMALSDGHRGKVVIGDTTLIFQFVVPPPVAVNPQLPASLKSSIKDRVDWPYAMALALALIVELPLVIWFQYAPQPEPRTLETIGERWAELIAPEIKTEKPKPPEQKGPENDAKGPKEKVAKKDDEPKDEAPDDQEKAQAKQQRRKEVRDSVAGKGVLALFGTKGKGGASGAIADVFAEGGGITGDLDSAFDGISGVGVATSKGAKSSRGGGSGEAASIGGLATSGGGKVATGEKKQTKVAAIKTAAPEVDGSLDSAAIAKVVRRRIRSLQDCYEKELKRDPSLAGKIEVEFTIGEDGRIEEAGVSNNTMGSDAVGSCIVSRVRRWRFPTPDGGSVTVNYPFIFTPSS
ncbi:MAG: AgmX/PglI C-terminal domain-containing protein, partial [Myxococcota bacterium]